jgi:hypothetical protein
MRASYSRLSAGLHDAVELYYNDVMHVYCHTVMCSWKEAARADS